MKFNFNPSPNYRHEQSTSSIMMDLTLGLLVVFAGGCVINFLTNGSTAVLHCLLVLAVSLLGTVGTEVIWALCTKKNVKEFLTGSYAWVTGIIIALTIRPNVALYAVLVSSVLAIFFGKLVFGGFGQNIFNPAGVARVIILTAFTTATVADVVSGATPISTISQYGWLMANGNAANAFLGDFGGWAGLLLGTYQGAIGETSALLLIAVGIWLSVRNVIDWKVPVTYVCTVFVSSLVIGLMNGQGLWYPLFAVLSGAVLFGGVFMLTDPVTNPTSSCGRIIFGIGAGILTVLIRVKAGTPEGVVFSILIMNMLTPLIERWVDGNQIKGIAKMKQAVYITAGLALAVSVLLGVIMEAPTAEYKSKKKPAATASGYADGTYEGSAVGFSGNLNVTVTISGGKIAEVVIDESENGSQMASDSDRTDLAAKMVEANSTSVDGISGCTITSDAAKEAVEDALSKAATGGAGGALTDGTYEGSAMGFSGNLNVTVTVSGGKITEVVIDESENGSQMASDSDRADLAAKMVEAGSTEVDGISGCTITSDAAKEAVEDALSKAQ